MALVIPTSKEVKQVVDVLKEIRDIEQKRLDVETIQLRLNLFLHMARKLVFTATVEGQSPQEDVHMLQLTDIQKCDLSVAPVDAKGNPAPVDGAPAWSVSDPTILSVTPTPDGLGATITALGPLGSCQVNVSADADLGAGVTTINGTLDVTVVASAATALNIGTGTPVNQ